MSPREVSDAQAVATFVGLVTSAYVKNRMDEFIYDI